MVGELGSHKQHSTEPPPPTNKNGLLFISLMQLPWRLMFIILHVPSCSCQCFLFSLTLIKRNDLLFSEMCKSPWFFITVAWNLPDFYLFLGFACKGFPGGSVLKKSSCCSAAEWSRGGRPVLSSSGIDLHFYREQIYGPYLVKTLWMTGINQELNDYFSLWA